MTSMYQKQSGAVLIIALVILAVATLLGVSVMQSASVESKMATNSQERQQALAAAESALKQAEQVYIPTILHADISSVASCGTTANATQTCFNTACINGLCFRGELAAGDDQEDCEVYNTTTGVVVTQFWEDQTLNVWNDSAKHQAGPNLPGYTSGTPPSVYIIEFRCFIDEPDDGSGTQGTVGGNTGDALYRITARGTSRSGRVDAIVQSTFRWDAPPVTP